MDRRTMKRTERINFDNLFNACAYEFKSAFERGLAQVRPDETGEVRETYLGTFLEKWLPEVYGIGNGYIVNRERKSSDQSDIVIYDRGTTPKYYLDEGHNRRIFPLGNVYGVIEAKSTLGVSELEDCLRKIQSFKSLFTDLYEYMSDYKEIEISEKPENFYEKEDYKKYHLRNNNKANYPFYFIFAYTSADLTFARMKEAFADAQVYPDGIVILDAGCFVVGSQETFTRLRSLETAAPIEKDDFDTNIAALKYRLKAINGEIDYLQKESSDHGVTLLYFYSFLMEFLTRMNLPRYNFGDLISIWRSRSA